jgi:hypothetical protein
MSTPPGMGAGLTWSPDKKTVTCSSTVSRDHTGTVMLGAIMPSQLTVTLNGNALQAMFLGVMLP